MIRSLLLRLDHDRVRFTPDGKISVMDVVAALSASDDPEMVWSEIVSENPELLERCMDFKYRDETIKVMDADGMAMLETLLFDYMIEQWQEAV